MDVVLELSETEIIVRKQDSDHVMYFDYNLHHYRHQKYYLLSFVLSNVDPKV